MENIEHYQNKLKELQQELSNDLEEMNLSHDEEESLYALKNYIDKRFDLLENLWNE